MGQIITLLCCSLSFFVSRKPWLTLSWTLKSNLSNFGNNPSLLFFWKIPWTNIGIKNNNLNKLLGLSIAWYHQIYCGGILYGNVKWYQNEFAQHWLQSWLRVTIHHDAFGAIMMKAIVRDIVFLMLQRTIQASEMGISWN